MNLSPASQIFTVFFNILMGPFTNPMNFENVRQIQDSSLKFLASLPSIPINLLKSSGLATCNTIIFKFGENDLKISLLPRGYCPNCCPVKPKHDIRYVLYTKSNPIKGNPIEPNNVPGAARRAGVVSTNPTVIFIHGFSEPSPGESGRVVADAYLSRKENYNIILVDWSELGAFPWYRPAVQNVRWVGDALKSFLELYNDSGEIPIGNVHIIGFSLGSHVASFTGKKLRRDLKIPRITALDPAFPEYSLRDSSNRLTASDAEYVDVIHTDAGVFGLPIAVGHVDYYPNGGKALQPGCQPSYLVQTRLIDQVLACSHVRAWRLYAESVRNPEAFPATKCANWRGPNRQCNFTVDSHLGYANKKREARGRFYLMTKHKSPYSMGMSEQMNTKN